MMSNTGHTEGTMRMLEALSEVMGWLQYRSLFLMGNAEHEGTRRKMLEHVEILRKYKNELEGYGD